MIYTINVCNKQVKCKKVCLIFTDEVRAEKPLLTLNQRTNGRGLMSLNRFLMVTSKPAPVTGQASRIKDEIPLRSPIQASTALDVDFVILR